MKDLTHFIKNGFWKLFSSGLQLGGSSFGFFGFLACQNLLGCFVLHYFIPCLLEYLEILSLFIVRFSFCRFAYNNCFYYSFIFLVSYFVTLYVLSFPCILYLLIRFNF